MSDTRRAGANLVKILLSSLDPATNPKFFQLYSKAVDGVLQLFGRSSNGDIHQITPAGILNPSFGTFYFDDFLGSELSTFGVTAGGVNGFGMAMGANRPGTVTSSVTAAGDATRTSLGGNANVTLFFGGGPVTFMTAHQIVTLSDGVNNVVVRDGYGDVAAADYVDGVYLEYDLATHGTQNYRLCAANNSVRTKVDTGIAAVAGTNRTIVISINAAGTLVSATIDGVASAATVATNIPVTAARVTQVSLQTVKQLGAVQRSVIRDFYMHRQTFTTPR